MEQFSKKEYLSLKMPTEDVPLGDRERISLALETLGYGQVTFPLPVLRKLYPLCRDAGFDITVTLVHREFDWVVTDLESAITIGIFPDLPREKYRVITNSSLEGARKLLLDRSLLEEAKHLSQNIYCVQFASIPDFLNRMQAAKFIPHTDRTRFPSVPF